MIAPPKPSQKSQRLALPRNAKYLDDDEGGVVKKKVKVNVDVY
jgi:hypothetical protein